VRARENVKGPHLRAGRVQVRPRGCIDRRATKNMRANGLDEGREFEAGLGRQPVTCGLVHWYGYDQPPFANSTNTSVGSGPWAS
jgi:hypothetical protein